MLFIGGSYQRFYTLLISGIQVSTNSQEHARGWWIITNWSISKIEADYYYPLPGYE